MIPAPGPGNRTSRLPIAYTGIPAHGEGALTREQFHSLTSRFWLNKIQGEPAYTPQFKSMLQNVLSRLEDFVFQYSPADTQAEEPMPPDPSPDQASPTEPPEIDLVAFCGKAAATIAQIWGSLGQPSMTIEATQALGDTLLAFFTGGPEASAGVPVESDGGAIPYRNLPRNQSQDLPPRESRQFAGE